jgi:hypothetical protein
MTLVACYDVIKDSNVSLKIGGDIDAEIPISVNGIDIEVRSVLSFMLKAEAPKNLKFELSIKNGKNVTTNLLTVTIGSDVWRVFQEVVDGNVLTKTGNILKIKVLEGGGTLVLSDIVLMFMKDV